MSSQTDVPQLAHQAQTALLAAIARAADTDKPDAVKAYAEAFNLIASWAPCEQPDSPPLDESNPWLNARVPTLDKMLEDEHIA